MAASRQEKLQFVNRLPEITIDFAKLSDAELDAVIRAMEQPAARKFAESNGGKPAWHGTGSGNMGQPVPGSRDFPTGGDGGRRQPTDKTSGSVSTFDDDVSSSSTSWDRTRDDGKVKMSEDDLTMAERNQMIEFLAGVTGQSQEILSMMNDLQLWSLYEKYSNPDEDSDTSMGSYSSRSSVPALDQKRSAMVARERRRQHYDEAHTIQTTQPMPQAPPRQMQSRRYAESSRYYQEGYSAGKRGDQRPCPYRDDPQRKDWMTGYADGFRYAGHAAADKPKWADFGTTSNERGAVAGFGELPNPVRRFCESHGKDFIAAGSTAADFAATYRNASPEQRRQIEADCRKLLGRVS